MKDKPMNEDTKYLLHRIDTLESRIMEKIEELQKFKHKMLGMAMVVSFLVTLSVEVFLRH